MAPSPSRFYYKGNRVKQLRAFCNTVKHETLSKAAEALYLSQPTISLQIAALERDLNTVLFERRGRRMALTPEGTALYELATPLIDGLETLDNRFARRMGDMESGELNIAAGESTSLYLLPRVLKRFQDENPNVHIRLHNVTGKDGLAMIRGDEVDFAVGSLIDAPPDVVFEPVHRYSPALIMSPDHPLATLEEPTLEQISPHGLILPPRRLTTWRMVDRVFQEHKIPYKVAMEAGGWEIIKRYVADGFGISIVISICLTGKENLVVRDMNRYFVERDYGVVVRKGKFLAPPARRFIDAMHAEFRQSTDLPQHG